MGRGRAKAKQTKVARDLKYRTYETDFERLQREMREQAAADSGTQDSDTDADGDTHADPDDGAEPSQRP